MTHNEVVIATNNGDIGGGEVMLLALASQLQALGCFVHVVAPSKPSALADRAREQGIQTIVLPAASRAEYMAQLRRWRRMHPQPLLWCNGLLPSLATAGFARRIVHLHQLPTGMHALLTQVARFRALATVVPSRFVGSRVKGSFMLENWVEEVPAARPKPNSKVVRLGFLGRLSREKGVDVLAAALAQLDREEPGRFRLLLAGEPRFVSAEEQKMVEKALGPISHLVEAPGWLPPADFFAAVDMLVCPSAADEAFGLVVAEAMSARVPFIISDAGALPEVAGENYPWMVPAGDAGKLAIAIRHAAGASELDVVDRAYERWRHHYSPEAVGPRVRDLLRLLGIEARPQGKR